MSSRSPGVVDSNVSLHEQPKSAIHGKRPEGPRLPRGASKLGEHVRSPIGVGTSRLSRPCADELSIVKAGPSFQISRIIFLEPKYYQQAEIKPTSKIMIFGQVVTKFLLTT